MAIIDGETLCVGDKVRFCFDLGGEPRGSVGTIVGIDYDEGRPYEVAWDEYTARYHRRELARVFYEREGMDVGKIETLAQMFAHEDERGRAKEPPSVDVIERGFAHVAAQLKAERMWVDRARQMVRDAPKGVDPNELVGLSNQVETLARAVDERERSFRQRLRLSLRSFIAGDI